MSRWFRDVGVIGLGLSAIVAAMAFFPRKLPVLHVGELRAYLRADVALTKLRLHDTQLAMIQTGSSELKRKARLLKLSRPASRGRGGYSGSRHHRGRTPWLTAPRRRRRTALLRVLPLRSRRLRRTSQTPS